MKKKSINLFLGLLMLAALGGGLWLVRQNQNAQKGAYFAGTDLSLLPNTITRKVGEVVPITLNVITQDQAKLSSLDTIVCYGNNLDLAIGESMVNVDSTEPSGATVELKDTNWEFISKEKVVLPSTSDNCIRLIAIAKTSTQPTDLKSGAIQLLTMRFSALSKGSGKVRIISGSTKVGGYNPTAAATDMALKVGNVADASYEITEGCTTDEDCEPGWKCINGSCEPGGIVTEIPIPTNSPVPTIPVGESPVLNYKVSFGSVKAGDAKCVVEKDWPLQVIVLGGGETRVYSGIIPSSREDVNGKLVLGGSIVLKDFNHFDNVAAFFKGPKHLQMKYAIQNQSGPYDKAGGTLVLTSDASTSPVYNFSAYPMLAGDVKGADTDTQDGWISGVDFAYVKSKAEIHETVDEGGYLRGDLDGNCQVNSNDVYQLKVSLEEKQGQLY